jgi:hypothetical protein
MPTILLENPASDTPFSRVSRCKHAAAFGLHYVRRNIARGIGRILKMPNEALIFWISITNLALGVAVIGVAAALAYGIAGKLMTRKQSHDIDAEVHALVQQHLAKGTAESEKLELTGAREH